MVCNILRRVHTRISLYIIITICLLEVFETL